MATDLPPEEGQGKLLNEKRKTMGSLGLPPWLPACLSLPLSACLCLALWLLRVPSLIACLVACLLILPPQEGQGKREETRAR